MLRSLVLWVLVWCLGQAFAVEPVLPADPLLSADADQALACLAQVEAPLAQNPTDQQVLGRALAAYVVLALPTPFVDAGDAGPFLGYARQVCARRQQARQGRPAADLTEALPELWLAAISGETKAAVDGLDRFPDADSAPAARALRAFATRDWRALAGRPPLLPLETYALAWARLQCGLNLGESEPVEILRMRLPLRMTTALEAGIDPDRHWNEGGVIRAALDDSMRMLAHPGVTEAEAVASYGEFLRAMNPRKTPAGDRQDLARQVGAIVSNLEARGEEKSSIMLGLIAAWHACDRILVQQGTAALHGPERLITLGDQARWNRDRLALLIHRTFVAAGKQSKDLSRIEEEVRPVIRERAPGQLPEAWALLRWSEEGHDEFEPYHRNARLEAKDQAAILAILQAEAARPVPHSLGVVMAAATTLAAHGPVPELPAFILALDGQRAAAGQPVPGMGDRHRWCRAATWGAIESDAALRARVGDWLARDPWDYRLRVWQKRWSPAHQRLDLPQTPALTWLDPQPGTTPRPRVTYPSAGNEILVRWHATRWQGWLRIPQAGTYQFHIDSPDGVRLTVGPLVFDKWFYRHLFGPAARSLTWTFPEAGWQPFRLEAFAGYGAAHPRLTWVAPGSEAAVPIPADCFAHGEAREPGAEAASWPNHNVRLGFIPTADDLAWLGAHPWFSEARRNAGQALAQHGAWAEAATVLSAVRDPQRETDRDVDGMLAHALVFRPDPDPARALTLCAGQQSWGSDWFDSVDGPRRLAVRLLQLGWGEELMAGVQAIPAERRDSQSNLVVGGIAAMATGDFVHAEAAQRKLAAAENRFGFIWAWEKRRALLETFVLARINGKPDPDVEGLLTKLTENGLAACPWDQVAADYLTGAIDLQVAQQRAAAGPMPAVFAYYHGLQVLAEHRWDEARAAFTAALGGEPDAPQTVIAAGLRTWLEQQKMVDLERRPRAAPIERRVSPAAVPVPSNF